MKYNILSRILIILFVSVLAITSCNNVWAGNERFHKDEQLFKCKNYCCNHFECVITLKGNIVIYHANDCKTLEPVNTHNIWIIIDKKLFEKGLPSHIKTKICKTCNTQRQNSYICTAKCCNKYTAIIDKRKYEVHRLDCEKLNTTVLPTDVLLICKDCYDPEALKKNRRIKFCNTCFKGITRHSNNYAYGKLM